MVYKFYGDNTDLELEQNNGTSVTITLSEKGELNRGVSIELNQNELYDLIGSLHSIQTKIKSWKGGNND